jgi:hypothetical protein
VAVLNPPQCPHPKFPIYEGRRQVVLQRHHLDLYYTGYLLMFQIVAARSLRFVRGYCRQCTSLDFERSQDVSFRQELEFPWSSELFHRARKTRPETQYRSSGTVFGFVCHAEFSVQKPKPKELDLSLPAEDYYSGSSVPLPPSQRSDWRLRATTALNLLMLKDTGDT